MHILKKLSFLLLIFALFSVAQLAEAAGSKQVLDTENSNIRFILNSSLVKLDGQFQKVRGGLELDEKNFNNSVFSIWVDLGAVTVKAIGHDKPLSVKPNLGALKNRTAIFVSNKIITNEDKTYTIEGEVRQGTKKNRMTFTVKALKISAAESKFQISAAGDVGDENTEPASPFTGDLRGLFTGAGILEGELHFVKK